MYQAFTLKKIWHLMDGFALNFHVLMYFIILLLNFSWWFNLANLIQFFAFVLINRRVATDISRFKREQKSENEEEIVLT